MNKYSRLSSFFAVLLLLLYSFAAIQFDLVHAVVHEHEEQTLHTPQGEKDPCHRAIYHGDETNGCHHKNHFITGKTKCSLCDVFFSREHLSVSRTLPIDKSISTEELIFSVASPIFFNERFHASRAPPLAA